MCLKDCYWNGKDKEYCNLSVSEQHFCMENDYSKFKLLDKKSAFDLFTIELKKNETLSDAYKEKLYLLVNNVAKEAFENGLDIVMRKQTEGGDWDSKKEDC